MRRLRAIPILLVVLALVAPVDARAPGEAALVAGRADFSGDFRVDLGDAVIAATEGAVLRVSAARAHVAMNWTWSVGDASGEDEVILGRGGWQRWIAPAAFNVTVREGGFAVTEASGLAGAATALVIVPSERDAEFGLRPEGTSPDISFRVEAPAGLLDVDGSPVLGGAGVVLFAYGAAITGDVAAVTGVRDETAGPFPFANVSFARVALTDATIAFVGGPARVLARGAEIAGSGTARFHGAAGRVIASDARAVESSATLVGDIVARATASGAVRDALGDPVWAPSPAWAVSGEFARVVVDGRAVSLPTAGALTIAVGAAAVAAVYALYSRIPTERILRHPLRRRMLDVILREPGILQEEAQRAAGATWSTFRYHLNVLEARNLVRRHRRGRNVSLYAASARESPADLVRGRGAATRLLAFIGDHPGSTATDAALALDVDHQLVYHHLKTLRALELVVATADRPARFLRVPARDSHAP